MKQLIAAMVWFASATAVQAEITSAYSTYDLAKCPVVELGNADEGYSGSYLCPGYKDQKIYFAEGDLRTLVGFGDDAQSSCSFRHTFPRFNAMSNTVEWRLREGKAFAVIQRWTVSFGDDEPPQSREWLMVSKLEEGASCHMVAVEAAMPSANEKARTMADQLSDKFSCRSDDILVLARSATDTSEVLQGPACVRE